MAKKFLKKSNGKIYKDPIANKAIVVDTLEVCENPQTVATEEEMTAFITAENEGKIVLYSGETGEYVNGEYYKITSSEDNTQYYELAELANPATAEDIASGKEAYGADGAVITGTAEQVENKLPLVAGAQSADNLYDITATDLEGVTEIRQYTFYKANGLRSIELPTTCNKIGVSAFYQCTALTSANMPNVTSTGSSGFNSCTALTTVDMPNMTSIGSSTFSDCSNLQSVNMPNVTSIGANGFYRCSALTSVDMPNVTSIGTNAFSNCSKLQSVNMPNVTSIDTNAFNTCSKLTSVNMPNVISIGGSAFRRSSLSSALIGSACTSIANYAFYETQSGVITIEATTPPALGGTSAFEIGTKIIVPVGCGETYKTATNWTTFADYIEEATE